jgi:hypothetical protein
MEPTPREEACFEAGIKFGALYHQFAGTPVSPASTTSLERAMEEAITNQPHCESVSVTIDPEALDTTRGYTELTGEHMTVEMGIEYEGLDVRVRMAMEEGYPLMAVESVSE